MKKACGILFTVIFVSFLISSIFAQEEAGDAIQEEADPMMSSMMAGQGSMGMSQMPMMGNMMMGRGGKMMERGGMMCSMCGNMTPMMGMMNMNMMEKMADKLNLTKEQRDKAMDIFIAHHKDMIKKKADIELAQIDLYELMSKDNPDMDAIQKQIMDMATMEGSMKFAQIKVWMDAKALLTDEQAAVLKKMMMGTMMGEKWMKESKTEKTGKSEKPGMKK